TRGARPAAARVAHQTTRRRTRTADRAAGDPEDTRGTRAARTMGARPAGGGRVRADPPATRAGLAAPRLREHPRLTVATLARRRADPARDPRGRRGNGRYDHA